MTSPCFCSITLDPERTRQGVGLMSRSLGRDLWTGPLSSLWRLCSAFPLLLAEALQLWGCGWANPLPAGQSRNRRWETLAMCSSGLWLVLFLHSREEAACYGEATVHPRAVFPTPLAKGGADHKSLLMAQERER